jgi:hypothetical protein
VRLPGCIFGYIPPLLGVPDSRVQIRRKTLAIVNNEHYMTASHFSLLSIAAVASPIPQKWAPGRYNLYVQMHALGYRLGYCVEKHRFHSRGAHEPGRTLAAQVIPRRMQDD